MNTEHYFCAIENFKKKVISDDPLQRNKEHNIIP